MPFTPSHVGAVLPFRRLRFLPFAALAAGSMSPDVPCFLPGLRSLGGWTHTLAGIVSLDVLVGLALWLLSRSVATPLHDLAPAGIREPGRHPAGQWMPGGECPWPSPSEQPPTSAGTSSPTPAAMASPT